METWSEAVDRLFADSDDEIEAFQVWLTYDADKAIVKAAMTAVMQPWMDSERREQARSRLDQALREERR